MSAFDPEEEFGIEAKIAAAWDITTQLACAAGLIALKDAGIPLTPVEQVGKGGLRLIRVVANAIGLSRQNWNCIRILFRRTPNGSKACQGEW